MTPARAVRRVAARAGSGQLKSVSARDPRFPLARAEIISPGPCGTGYGTGRA